MTLGTDILVGKLGVFIIFSRGMLVAMTVHAADIFGRMFGDFPILHLTGEIFV